MNRRQFLLGSGALAALPVLPAFAIGDDTALVQAALDAAIAQPPATIVEFWAVNFDGVESLIYSTLVDPREDTVTVPDSVDMTGYDYISMVARQTQTIEAVIREAQYDWIDEYGPVRQEVWLTPDTRPPASPRPDQPPRISGSGRGR